MSISKVLKLTYYKYKIFKYIYINIYIEFFKKVNIKAFSIFNLILSFIFILNTTFKKMYFINKNNNY
jgi:hypothetical protein